MTTGNGQPKSPAAPVADKFVVPPEWRERCEIRRMNPQTKTDYVPIHLDTIKSLLEVKNIDFLIFFLVGWDLYEFIRPADFSHDLVREMVEVHKKWPSQTRIVVLRKDHPRYEKIAAAFRKNRFVTAAAGAAMPLTPVFNCYAELSNASQLVVRGALHAEVYGRVAGGASYAVMHMPSTRDVLNFIVSIIGRDPVLYDHAAVSAFVASAIAWNALRLPKRESKLCGQAALMHDVERHCAYLMKPPVAGVISAGGIKEVQALRDQGVGFHDCVTQTMQQYRERFGGAGIPNGLSGTAEEKGDKGITRIARIVAIGCAFSEYLLKRQDKQPLTLPVIIGFLRQRAGTEFDPKIMDAFLADISTGAVRKPGERDGDGDDFDFADDE